MWVKTLLKFMDVSKISIVDSLDSFEVLFDFSERGNIK